MTTATLYFVSSVSGNVSTPDNALGAADGVFTTDANATVSWTHRWRLGTVSSAAPTGTQSLTLVMRKGTNTGNPTVSSVTLYQGGASLGALTLFSGSTTIDSTTGQELVYQFDGSLLADMVDVDIEIATAGTGGAPANKNAASIDAGVWAANYDIVLNYQSGDLSSTGLSEATSVSGATVNSVSESTGAATAMLIAAAFVTALSTSIATSEATFTGGFIYAGEMSSASAATSEKQSTTIFAGGLSASGIGEGTFITSAPFAGVTSSTGLSEALFEGEVVGGATTVETNLSIIATSSTVFLIQNIGTQEVANIHGVSRQNYPGIEQPRILEASISYIDTVS